MILTKKHTKNAPKKKRPPLILLFLATVGRARGRLHGGDVGQTMRLSSKMADTSIGSIARISATTSCFRDTNGAVIFPGRLWRALPRGR